MPSDRANQVAAAAKVIHGWEASGKIGDEPPDVPNIRQAVAKYLADAASRHLAPETVRKRRELLEGKLVPFCDRHGYEMLTHLDVDVLRTFRASWPYSPLSARKRLEYLRSFFRFCHDAGWVDRNPAMAVKASKVEQNPTLPFSAEEIERILEAARKLRTSGTTVHGSSRWCCSSSTRVCACRTPPAWSERA